MHVRETRRRNAPNHQNQEGSAITGMNQAGSYQFRSIRWRRRERDVPFAEHPRPATHTLVVNGERIEALASPTTTLLQVLRDQLTLTGSKEACGRGECGACTVLVGETAVMACTVLALLTDGPVETIEGITESARDLREAFADHGGFQCGYCTPGQIVRAEALLRDRRPLDEATVRSRMAGNFCRCTGYAQIVDAVLATAVERRTSASTGRGELRSVPEDVA